MKKLIVSFIALMFTGAAYAGPVTYAVDTSVSGNPWTGTFSYDASIGGAAGFTALALSENFFNDSGYGVSSVQGDSTSTFLHLIGPCCGDDSNWSFASALGANSLADISFVGTVQCSFLCFHSPNPYHFEGVLHVIPVAAPEPATLALFGAGLAGLSAVRRRRQTKA